jgi:hypothetical protein
MSKRLRKLEEKIQEDPFVKKEETIMNVEITIEKKDKEEIIINVEIMIETSIDKIIEGKIIEHMTEISIETIDLKETMINQESNTNRREKKIERDVLH